MKELVNTSLPNGLIPGTHGFATVAMTKGLPDYIREKLERLCAYTHLVSTHDKAYETENPVNWFHVVLTGGEHVVGRVAACEFDYTGRTNRIAKLRMYSANELPEVGAVTIISADKAWYSEKWEGEARYLEENVHNTLTSIKAAENKGSSAWIKRFGESGARLAQRVAWQLEQSVMSNGKPIFFKTSAKRDAAGDELLAMFADVIELLPRSIRNKVCFSTYPGSLPAGTVCHLRGVFGEDKLFSVISSTDPWVDCESGKVVNETKLPNAGITSKVGVETVANSRKAVSTIQPKPTTKIANKTKTNGFGDLVEASHNGSSEESPTWLIGIIVVAVLVVALIAIVLFMFMSSNKTMHDSGTDMALQVKQEEIRKLKEMESEQDRENQRYLEEQRRQEAARLEKAKEEADKAKEAARLEKERKAEEERSKKEAEERAKKETEAELEKIKRENAFLGVNRYLIGIPDKPNLNIRIGEVRNNSYQVFYYEDGSLVRKEICWAPKKNISNRAAGADRVQDYKLEWSDRQDKRKCEDVLLESPCVIWVQGDQAWFDFKHARVIEGALFEKVTSIDLRALFFGQDERVFKAWTDSAHKETYAITWSVDGEPGELECLEGKLELKDVIGLVYETSLSKLASRKNVCEKAVDDIKKQIANKENELKEITDELEPYERSAKEIKDMKQKLAEIKEKQDDVSSQIKKNKRKNLEDERDRLKKAWADLNSEIRGKEARLKKPVDLIARKNKLDKEIEAKRKDLENATKKMNEATESYDKAYNDPNKEETVRETVFSIALKGVE